MEGVGGQDPEAEEGAREASEVPEAMGGAELGAGLGAPPVTDEEEVAHDPPGSLAARVRELLPLAIVAVSVLAAVMGWRASLADESSTHMDELSRQDLVRQQDSVLQKIEGVDADVRLFTTYEEDSILAQQLSAESAQVGGATGQALATEAQGYTQLARGLGSQFQYSSDYNPSNQEDYYSKQNSNAALQPDGTYRPGNPYRVSIEIQGAESGDAALTGLEPDVLRANAKAERQKGVNLVGIAALFIAALVCFTIAAVSRGRQLLWLATSGLAIGVIALILFPIAELS